MARGEIAGPALREEMVERISGRAFTSVQLP